MVQRRALIQRFAALPLALAIASCASIPTGSGAQREIVVPPKADAYTAGLEAIGGSNPWRFIEYYRELQASEPDKASELLGAYAVRSRADFESALKAGDALAAKAAYLELRAAQGADRSLEARLARGLAEQAEREGFEGARRLLALDAMGRAEARPEAGIDAIRAYGDALCGIVVHTKRLTANGITRADMPLYSGSGMLVDGTRILTCWHIIEPALGDNIVGWSIEAFKNGESIGEARLVSYDAIDDLALLALESPLPGQRSILGSFGDSRALEQGDVIYCLGNPRGFDSTLTRGIVSSRSRTAPELGEWLQIDSAVAPGSSGGLVIGDDGLVYGMIVAGVAFEDLNFAIPSRLILERFDSLNSGKKQRKPWLGLRVEGPFAPQELRVADVFPSSVLAGMGIAHGSLIESIDGMPVSRVGEAQAIVSGKEPGALLRVGFKSPEGESRELFVRLGARPEYALYSATKDYEGIEGFASFYGFSIKGKAAEIKLGSSGNERSVLLFEVGAVLEGSAFANFGVEAGDLLGLMAAEDDGLARRVAFVHLPESLKGKKVEDPNDLVISLELGRYDANIL
jgi:S1-C subfamily serine protease